MSHSSFDTLMLTQTLSSS